MKAATASRFSLDLGRLKKPAYSAFVLAIMASIGLWGHLTHWSLSGSHAEVSASNARPAPSAASKAVPDRQHSQAASAAEQPAGPAEVPSGVSFKPADPTEVPARIEFPSAAAVGQLGIETAPPERRSISREVSATAVVSYEPSRQAHLSARVAGTLWRLEKHVGDAVQAGDVLAIIDSPAVGEAKAEFLTALADVELRKKAHDRVRTFDNGEVPRAQIEEAATELRKARVGVFNAQQALISLGFSIKLDDWGGLGESQLEERIKFLGLPESIVGGLEPDSTTASLLPIYAPFDGVVIGHNLAKGEVVSPSQEHFQIADVSRMWIVLHVHEQDADGLEVGQKVSFVARNVKVAGTLSWLSTEVDEKTRTVEVRCEVDNPRVAGSAGQSGSKRLLRANLFGLGKIQIHENPHALVVPSKAVHRGGTSHVVFVSVGDRAFEARCVTTGIVTGEYTEIVDGLADSSAVVTQGSHVLKAELQRFASAGPRVESAHP